MSVKFQKEKYFKNIGIKPDMDKDEEVKLLEEKLRKIQWWSGMASLDARNNAGLRIAKKQWSACSQRLYELGERKICKICGQYVRSVDANGSGFSCHI